MQLKSAPADFWKLPACGVAFFIGMALGGLLLLALDFQAPEKPAGTDANTIAVWFLLGSMLLAYPLTYFTLGLLVCPW